MMTDEFLEGSFNSLTLRPYLGQPPGLVDQCWIYGHRNSCHGAPPTHHDYTPSHGASSIVHRNNIAAIVTRSSLPVGIHDASHQESDGRPLAGTLVCGAGMLAAAPAAVAVAAGYRDPRPRAGSLCCHVVPTCAGDAAGGARGKGSESPGIPAGACPGAARRGRWLGDSAPES